MGKRFDVVYDDFTGGHFVGPSQANQPRNTWIGDGVICTADEGFLMADGGWEQSEAAKTSGTLFSLSTLPLRARSVHGDYGTMFVLGDEVYTVKGGNADLRATFAEDVAGHATIGVTGDYVVFGALASDKAYKLTIDGSWAATNDTTYGNPSDGVWRWKDWLIHTEYTTLYFSNPGAYSWAAANTIEFPGPDIRSLASLNDQLLVQTAEGWYAVSGVLGETTTRRKIGNIGGREYDDFQDMASVAVCEAGVVFVSSDGSALWLLTGTQVVPFAHVPGASFSAFASASEHLLALTGTDVWIWSNPLRRWRRTGLPSATTLGYDSIDYCPSEDYGSTTDVLSVVSVIDTGLASPNTYAAYVWDTAREPVQPVATAGVFDTATAVLSEYQHPGPFRVHEILVEVDFGQPADQEGARSLVVSAITNAITDVAATFARDGDGNPLPAQSAALTRTWSTATATKNGDREMVRFPVNDAAPATYTAAPKLAMKGVKVRRVIMRCEEV